jgi:hypothetical protein
MFLKSVQTPSKYKTGIQCMQQEIKLWAELLVSSYSGLLEFESSSEHFLT